MADHNFTSIDDLIDTYNKGKTQHVSGGVEHSENKTIDKKTEHFVIHEVVEHEHKKEDKELDHFIDVRKDTIDISEKTDTLGVESTGTSSFIGYNAIKLPISDDKVVKGLHAPISSSIRWLSEFCVYILRAAHLKLKKIHGKIVRVIQN
jgi:hypothetical protein